MPEYKGWNQLYLDTKDKAKQREKVEQASQLYGMLPEAEYSSIENCVNYAIKNGNHLAFAKYYIEQIHEKRSHNKMFADMFVEKAESKGVSIRFNQIKVMKSDCWRNPDYEYLKSGILSNAMFSNYKSGRNLPDRDVIVQLGIFFDMNLDCINEMLVKSGAHGLYLLDLVDAVVMYYLEKGFTESEIKDALNALNDITILNGVKELDKEIQKRYAKLYIIKKKINDKLGEYEKGSWKDFIVYAKSAQSKKEEEVRAFFSEKFDLEKMQAMLSNKIKKEKHNEVEKSHTNYITSYFCDVFQNSASLEDFLKEVDSKESINAFTNRHYAVMLKIYKILNDDLMYEKNLICQGLYKNFMEGEWKSDFQIDDYQRTTKKNTAVKKIFAYKNHICDDEGRGDFISFHHGLSSVDNLLEGRPVKVSSEDYSELFDLHVESKGTMLKYAIAAGHEEDINSLMVYAGYWKENKLSKHYKIEEDKTADCYDYILFYAYCFREALLDKRDKTEINDQMKRLMNRKNFPFLELIMGIARDIQAAYKIKLMQNKDKANQFLWFIDDVEEDEKSRKKMRSMIDPKTSYLIFPVQGSNHFWFLGYE